MVSKIHRRSGNAVVQHCKLLNWHPDVVWQVGVGQNHQEIDCLLEEWPEIRMFGFEPHPKIYNDIKDKFPGELFNVAVSYKTGKAVLYSKPRHKDGSTTLPGGKSFENANTYEVETDYLDNMDLLPSPDPNVRELLWLDCEGCELDVLQGARRFIKRVDSVNVEMTGAPEGEGWSKPEEVHEQLVEDGFFLQVTHTNRPSNGQFDGLYVRPHLFNPRYCNCPSEILRHRKVQQ